MSIKNVFNQFVLFLTISLLLVGIVALSSTLEKFSYEKIENLQSQKSMIKFISELDRSDIELTHITIRGKRIELQTLVQTLKSKNEYDLFSKFNSANSKKYILELSQLSRMTNEYLDQSSIYYENSDVNQTFENLFRQKQKELFFYIDNMIVNNIKYSYDKFILEQIIIFAALFTLIFSILWYSRKLSIIHKDILSLYSVDADVKNHIIITNEVKSISSKMNRKPITSENPAYIDILTNIKNNKGLLHAYSNKKNVKDNNYICISILTIDKFKDLNAALTKELSQSILKRVASILTLHEQFADIVARISYDQFAFILTRPTEHIAKVDLQKAIDAIKEIHFKTTNNQTFQITLSCGFVAKSNNVSLDETINQAKSYALNASNTGGDKISDINS